MSAQYLFDNRPYVLWGRVYTKQKRNVLSIDAQHEIAEYFIGRKAENIFFDEDTDTDTDPDLNNCKNLWLAIEYAKANNFLLVIAKASSLRNIDEALLIVDNMGEKNVYFCDVPFMDRFALKCAFEYFDRQTLIKGIYTKIGLQHQQKSLKEKGYFVNKRGETVTHLGNDKGCDMSKATEASAERRKQKKREWKESSPAYQWIKSQIIKGKGTGEIFDEFQELAKHQPDVYCRRSGKPMTYNYISIWKKEILKELATGTPPQAISTQNIEDEFAVIERKSDAVEFAINSEQESAQRLATPSVVINPQKLHIFEQQTKAAQELLSDIFVDEEAVASQDATSDNTTNVWMDLLKSLLTKELWERAEVENMCKERGLMLGAVLEQINDFAYEKVDDAVVEDDGENIYVTLDYKEQLI